MACFPCTGVIFAQPGQLGQIEPNGLHRSNPRRMQRNQRQRRMQTRRRHAGCSQLHLPQPRTSKRAHGAIGKPRSLRWPRPSERSGRSHPARPAASLPHADQTRRRPRAAMPRFRSTRPSISESRRKPARLIVRGPCSRGSHGGEPGFAIGLKEGARTCASTPPVRCPWCRAFSHDEADPRADCSARLAAIRPAGGCQSAAISEAQPHVAPARCLRRPTACLPVHPWPCAGSRARSRSSHTARREGREGVPIVGSSDGLQAISKRARCAARVRARPIRTCARIGCGVDHTDLTACALASACPFIRSASPNSPARNSTRHVAGPWPAITTGAGFTRPLLSR